MRTRMNNKAEVEAAIRKWAGIKGATDIGKTIGVSGKTVSEYAWRFKISLALKAKIEKRKRAEQFIRQYHKSMTCAQISYKLKIDCKAISRYARLMGMQLKNSAVIPAKPRPEINGFFNEHARENWLL
jgi:hypothetical protein